MPLIKAHTLITGQVQGVFFRQSTCNRARELGLRGWVKNLLDGRVEAMFIGEKAAVEAAVAFVHEGPPQASVSEVKVTYSKAGDTSDSVDDPNTFSID